MAGKGSADHSQVARWWAVSHPPPLVLASRSPSRLRLLRAAGIEPEVEVSGVPEDDVDPAVPQVLVATLARRKARAVARRRVAGLILGCDSALELDGMSHGKPATATQAAERWRRMNGAEAVLHTGHCLIDVATQQTVEAVASTIVRFARISDADIDAYVGSGEPLAVAGAFTLDGLSAPFIEGVDGDPSNVIGLSLPVLRTLLAELGVAITSLWNRVPVDTGSHR
ncbi:MAG: Maf family nucleotide pyrophosphatase [Actinomycetota bacterium]|nr:Maf family nucleotide pyrophosphatase [Actinomycetota bacterium]